ncbi:hypothetical protein ACO0QE_004771 [Hanseniaspora vineae]
MSQGTLYTFPSPRSTILEALIKAYKIDVTVKVGAESKEFATYFPLKKAPAFVGPKGFKLTECIAIAYYCMLINLLLLLLYVVFLANVTWLAHYNNEENMINLIEDEKVRDTLLGRNNVEKASVLKWLSFVNGDIVAESVKYYANVKNLVPYNKKVVENASAKFDEYTQIIEQRLKEYTFLVAERITLADVFVGGAFTFFFSVNADAAWRKAHPAITRWFNTVIKSEPLVQIFADFKPVDKKLEFVPPKKEKKPAAKKPEAAAKKPEAPAAEAPAAEAKKPKHPLELLGKSTFNLDEWKREYSNNDTRPVALPWFWEHYNPEEYSIWKVSYKYNDELTLTFMSNNLVGGFINRLSGSVKYMFGCLVVYGENNNNGIIGAVMIRGQEFKPAFDVAPDWESYDYEKLDVSTEENKEFVNNMWAWDKPVVVNGESKEIADGKVLK